jgi:hypothetical protein
MKGSLGHKKASLDVVRKDQLWMPTFFEDNSAYSKKQPITYIP